MPNSSPLWPNRLWKVALRFVEVVGVVTAVVFVLEVFTQDRALPSMPGHDITSESAFDFLWDHEGQIVYLSVLAFDDDESVTRTWYSDTSLRIGIFTQDGFLEIGDVGVMQSELLTDTDFGHFIRPGTDEQAAGWRLWGPAFVRLHQIESAMIRLLPVPFSDSLASKVHCTEHLIDANWITYPFRYISNCML